MSRSVPGERPVRARCPLGGHAPCVDDLCHSVDTTVCGLEWGVDFCDHGFIPETCPDCRDPEGWEDDDDGAVD